MKIQKSVIAAGAAVFALAPTAAVAQAAGPSAHAARLGHKIVLFKSIGGVRLGMSTKQVKHKLGKPQHTTKAGSTVDYEYDNSEGLGTMDVSFDRGRVMSVQTFVSSVRTSQGIRIGSSVRALKHAYRGSLKHAIGGFQITNRADDISTQFIVGGGKVESIAIFKF